MNLLSRTFASDIVYIAMTLLFASPIVAQSNCTTEAPKGIYAVAPGATVYYSVDSSAQSIASGTSGDSPQTQISNAFTAWNTANAGPGGDGTQFLPATPTNQASVTITTNYSYTGSAVAVTSVSSSGTVLPTVNPATITLFPNSGGGYSLQPLAPGYDTAYTQIMVHEIGHLMGFDDYPPGQQSPVGTGASAMNNLTGVNGTGQFPPTVAPTTCDTTTAAQYASSITFTPLPPPPTTTTPPSSGGKGGGGSGKPAPGGGGYCTGGDEYWDEENQDLETEPVICYATA